MQDSEKAEADKVLVRRHPARAPFRARVAATHLSSRIGNRSFTRHLAGAAVQRSTGGACGCGKSGACRQPGDEMGDPSHVQRAPMPPAGERGHACPGYGPNEVTRSRSEGGVLPKPVITAKGVVVVGDFGVGRSAVKGRVKRDPLLLDALKRVEQKNNVTVGFVGVDDCVGNDLEHREQLRQARAESVRALLSPKALPRVTFTDGWPLDNYVVTSNANAIERAANRSALIFWQDSDGKQPKPKPKDETQPIEIPRGESCGDLMRIRRNLSWFPQLYGDVWAASVNSTLSVSDAGELQLGVSSARSFFSRFSGAFHDEATDYIQGHLLGRGKNLVFKPQFLGLLDAADMFVDVMRREGNKRKQFSRDWRSQRKVSILLTILALDPAVRRLTGRRSAAEAAAWLKIMYWTYHELISGCEIGPKGPKQDSIGPAPSRVSSGALGLSV